MVVEWQETRVMVGDISNSIVTGKYAKYLFYSELKLTQWWSLKSLFGKAYDFMSGRSFFRCIARQRSFEVIKT